MTEEDQEIVVHENPAWRERSNFIIHVRLPEKNRPKRFEQLWTRQLGDNRFEVCCIPFLASDLALGDVVMTAPQSGLKYLVHRMVVPSGRHVLRAWPSERSLPGDEIAADLMALGALIEWSPCKLLAVDAADDEHAQVVADFLAEHERAGHLTYETGIS
jgi:uncharacterized protein DUF4265